MSSILVITFLQFIICVLQD